MNISVYITSYNKSNFLTKAIESVLMQSYEPLEIIIVDDYSEDQSQDIIHSFYNRYPNIIKPIYNENNLGISKTRNIALEQVNGELITFLDGDDYFYPNKLEYEYSILKKFHDYQAVYSNFHYINEKGDITGKFAKTDDTPATGDIFINTYTRDYQVHSKNNYIYEMFYSNCLDKIGNYDKDIPLWEDWDFRIRFSKHFKYGYCPQINSAYRKSPTGIHNSEPKFHFREQIKIHNKNKPLINDLKLNEKKHIQNRVYSKIKNLFKLTLKGNIKNQYYFNIIYTCFLFILTFKTWKSVATAFKNLKIK